MGKLTTHVLDTAQGKPGAGITFRLFRVTGNGRELVREGATNRDGRADAPLLSEDEFAVGTWELDLDVAAYFAAQPVEVADPPFLDRVTLRFSTAADEHYHVPLLVSPWSYSTYRGS
ncbi:MAG: hydroxyisourate hydrolase [Gammaproteobacteria bacterium]|nr:hydroxyisourate hydrolase [Gammaproteobacteria bacterium]